MSDYSTSNLKTVNNVWRVKDIIYKFPAPYENTHSRFYNSAFVQTDSSVKLDLNELTKKDIVNNNGQYLGKHEGTWSNPAVDNFIVSTKPDVSAGGLVGTSVDRKSKDINYLYINNPYSTYGVLFTNGYYDQKFFYQGIDSRNYGNLYTNVNDTSELNYIDSLKGNVTYKGNVIASITRGIKDTREGTITEAPKVDGTITLDAYFGDFAAENSIKGQLVSNTVGTVDLLQTRQGTNLSFKGRAQQLDDNNQNKLGNNIYLNYYSGEFVGKEANDVVGEVNFRYDTDQTKLGVNDNYKADKDGNNPIVEYNAVFGATKQPKAE